MKTIGIDTNVLIAFRLKREPQYTKAKAYLQNCSAGKTKLYIPLPVILEIEWVLRSFYNQPKDKVVNFLEGLLEIENILSDFKTQILFALNLYRNSQGVNFTDCVIATLMQNLKVDNFLTFDKQLEKLYKSIA